MKILLIILIIILLNLIICDAGKKSKNNLNGYIVDQIFKNNVKKLLSSIKFDLDNNIGF
jgi:amino acid permease